MTPRAAQVTLVAAGQPAGATAIGYSDREGE